MALVISILFTSLEDINANVSFNFSKNLVFLVSRRLSKVSIKVIMPFNNIKILYLLEKFFRSLNKLFLI